MTSSGPHLVFEETSTPCGYAPRTILLSTARTSPEQDFLFVGCKDGSITVVEYPGPGKKQNTIILKAKKGKAAVRSISEWDSEHLLVGRTDGDLELLHWRQGVRDTPGGRPDQAGEFRKALMALIEPSGEPPSVDPLLSVERLDEDRFLASFRKRGAWVFHRTPDLSPAYRLELPKPHPGGIRFTLPLANDSMARKAIRWLLISDRGDLLHWDGRKSHPTVQRIKDDWPAGERPATINDIGILRHDIARREGHPARGVFLAADTGVYLVTLTSDGTNLAPCRLSIPGLGAACTALSYAENEEHRFLWAADASGDCHLYWDESRDATNWGFNFRRSGLIHADSQVLVACAWVPEPSKDMEAQKPPRIVVFGQARRNDRIVLSEYRLPADEPSASVSASESASLTTRRLLSDGSSAEVRAELKRRHLERHPPQYPPRHLDKTPEAAVLAIFFEELMADPNERRILLESLHGPCKLADEILGQVSANAVISGNGNSRALGRALELWTLTLLSAIHRSSEPSEGTYLALLRWLRDRERQLRGVTTASNFVDVFEESVRFARKWGVYGEANSLREDLLRPLAGLQAQVEKREKRIDSEAHSRIPERLDALTYQVLLYRRHVSLIHRVEQPAMRGRTAWQVAMLDIEGDGKQPKRLVACSWIWGGIELFEVVGREGKIGRELVARHALRPREHRLPDGSVVYEFEPENIDPGKGPPKIPRYVAGYSRAFHLGSLGDTTYLLTASTTDTSPGFVPGQQRGTTGRQSREKLLLWSVADHDSWLTIPSERQAELDLGGREDSVYSMMELEDGYFVVGLRGYRGGAKIRLLRIRRIDGVLKLEWKEPAKILDLKGSGPRVDGHRTTEGRPSSATSLRSAEQAETNRVWSLARGPLSASGDSYHVVVGCDRGQIYRVTLERDQNEGWSVSENPELVSHMGSAVLALDYHEGKQMTRVYAGCEDGTVAAWQELDGTKGVPTDERRASCFASVWATSERDPIAGIHRVEGLQLDKQTNVGASEDGAVLAVSREGRFVLFDDRVRCGEPNSDRPGPHRTPFPGCRHGRGSLGSSCFASLVVDVAPSSLDLLVASGEGTSQLVSLRHPSHTDQRSDEYKNILRTWWGTTEGRHHLRLAGALYRAAPAMEGILVRWLLDPTYPKACEADRSWDDEETAATTTLEAEDVQPWWLPRHLRPLLNLRRFWDRLQDEPNAQKVETLSHEVGYALELALRRAWQLDDLALFQEICEVVLKRANFLLFETLGKKRTYLRTGNQHRTGRQRWAFETGKLETLYDRLLRAVERPTNRWVATEDNEARARMTILKHLVDGDTFWRLVLEAGDEKLPPPDLDGPCNRILQRRIVAISDLIFKRNPLVNLEALRAANLSLFRLSKRLSDKRERVDGGWAPGPRNCLDAGEIHWSVFEYYFRHLVAAAARTFGSHLELNDALAHEYARTFALAICACPSGTIRIANRMSETLVIADPDSEDDLSHRVERQLRLLEQMGLEYPDWVIPVFRGVARPATRGEQPAALTEDILGGNGHAGLPSDSQIVEDLDCLNLLYGRDGVLGWFVALERKLANDAQDIDLTQEGLHKVAERIQELEEQDEDKLYDHSLRFWKKIHKDLEVVLKIGVQAKSQKEIRPEVVLASQKLARWAGNSLRTLEDKYRNTDIFQPEYRNFGEVLNRLGRTAETFRTSAAVQKNIVVGVLGHHLLEELDEHVLELLEIAQVLDPWMVLAYLNQELPVDVPESGGASGTSTAERFARYLVDRSRKAESIPKNLRALQSLLFEAAEDTERTRAQDNWRMIRREVGHWSFSQNGWPEIAPGEARFLRLVFQELDQNDRIYGPPRGSNGRPAPELKIRPTGDGPSTIDIVFRIRKDLCGPGEDDAIQRLDQLKEAGLQQPFTPWRRRSHPSHGTGLYLANLAASVVNWQLEIHHIDDGNDGQVPSVTFRLSKLDEPEPEVADQ